MSGDSMIQARFQLRRPGFTLDVDLNLPGQGITVLQGCSGSGKTTVLRCIAGLEQPDNGHLKVNGTLWQGPGLFVPTYQRSIGYVFQEDSLFEHLTADRNILFGCRERHRIPEDLMPVIDLLGIRSLLHRYPRALSGGERQRVAIARALAVKPDVLLLDEPLSSLDTDRKSEILSYLTEIRDLTLKPILYVTHDPVEAEQLATHLVVLQDGRVVA